MASTTTSTPTSSRTDNDDTDLAATATGVQLERANQLIQGESDEVLAVGTSLSLGLAMGLLLGGANRLLVILALIPATAMGFTLFDRHGGTRSTRTR